MKLPHVAALYVQTGGSYCGLEGVDVWDEGRDARNYCGPHSVIAHPPCQRWGKLWAGQPLMMIQLELARIKTSPEHADHWIDVAGYAACGGEVAVK
jgi:hypothetical protein